MPIKLPVVPVAFFGFVLGLSVLAMHGVSRPAFPSIIGEALMQGAAVVGAVLVLLYAAKWVTAPKDALGELEHPVQCCFVGLIGVTTMLIAAVALLY
jgi:tellurite resistance protein